VLISFPSTEIAILLKRQASVNDISDLLKIRVVASFLGEKSQFNWWNSDFFGASAPSFLNPIFPRTRFLAQAEGSSAAARKLHDDRIGVGLVFHLFRLPEDFELSFHQRLQEVDVTAKLSEFLSDKDSALKFMESEYGKPKSDVVGPVLVGEINQITSKSVVESIAQAYLSGFQRETPVFPYLKEEL
jgi:hypothetical protein